MLTHFQKINVGFLCLTIVLAMDVSAQSMVVAESGAEIRPVVGMNGENLVISVDGDLQEVSQGRVQLVAAPIYTDGGINVVDKKVGVRAAFEGDGSKFNFQFRLDIDAERDFEDCFVLFVVESREGKTFQKFVDLDDINEGRQLIDVGFTTSINFGDSRYGYVFFSKGEEIVVDDPFRKKAMAAQVDEPNADGVSRDNRPSSANERSLSRNSRSPSRLDATPARVVDQRIPEYPFELRGSGVNGIARVLYTMNETGRVVEILDMKADHPAFLRSARDVILNSKYEPSIYEGQPLVTTIEQVFAFDEFVCFAEAAEIVPYPEVKNREPLAVYGPNRAELAERLKKVVGKSVALEIEINELGQVVSVGAKGVDSDVVDRTFDNAFTSWVFLPSLDQGVAYSKRIRLQLADKR